VTSPKPPSDAEINEAIVDPGYSSDTRKNAVKSRLTEIAGKSTNKDNAADAAVRNQTKRSVRARQSSQPKTDDAL